MIHPRWFLLLLAAFLGAGVALVLWPKDEPDVPAPLPLRPAEDYAVPVWYGRSGETEFAVLPFYSDAERDGFNRARWNRFLGLDDDPREFAMLWVVNHGTAAVSRPDLRSGGWTVRSDLGTVALTGAEDVMAEAGDAVPVFFRRIVSVFCSTGVEEVAPGTMIRTALILPSGVAFDDIHALEADRGRLKFRAARIPYAVRLAFERRPRGQIAERLRYDESIRAEANDAASATRNEDD